jgi:hypothetical protein
MNRDDPRLREYPQYGTWSPYLVRTISQLAANERYQSDRAINMSHGRMLITTVIEWESEAM